MKNTLLLFTLFSLTLILFSCKKNDSDDTTVYRWKRELVSDVALNPLNNPNDSSTSATFYVVATDYVYLTNAQMKAQEKSKRKDGTIFYYRFSKVEE